MKELASKLASKLDKPEFPHRVAYARSYDDLHADVLSEGKDPTSLLSAARLKGRVLLHAPAGSGKTYLLTRLFASAAAEDLATFINLRRWTPRLFSEWSVRSNETQRMALLLDELAVPGGGESEVGSEAKADSVWYVFVDALNEAPAPYPQQVLQVLDSFARRNPFVGIVVADRISRRSLPSDRWTLATILPLPHADVRSLLGSPTVSHIDLFERPFFLNMALKHPVDSTTEAAWFMSYFQDQIGLTEPQLSRCSSAAFLMYEQEKARSFDFSEFSSIVDDTSAVEVLKETGTLLSGPDERSYFSHHLFHDFLVAHYLARTETAWNPKSFNIATFRASSFDVLFLTLELIGSFTRGDLFIRRLYDWNPYAPAYAIAMASPHDKTVVSESMKRVIAAMLAERRWEVIASTAHQASDALRLLDTSWAKRMLEATQLNDVLAATTGVSLDESFEPWRKAFLGQYPQKNLLEKLNEEDSLLGWTAANVLRRAPIPSTEASLLLAVLDDPSPTIRWRAIHVMGSQPTKRFVKLLAKHLTDDPDYWVRFGALRSIVEIAATSSDLRRPALDILLERLPVIRASDLLWELERALILQDPPKDWPVHVASLLEWLWASATTVEDQDHWREVAYQVERASQAGA